MGKKNEINPFTVSELQIFRCHGVANPADRTQVIQSDRGIAGENIHILGNGHAQVTLSSRCVGAAVWGCALTADVLFCLPWVGLVQSGLLLSGGSRGGPEAHLPLQKDLNLMRG